MAVKSRSLLNMVRERDHGLSERGVAQCAALEAAIGAAAARGDADARAIVTRGATFAVAHMTVTC